MTQTDAHSSVAPSLPVEIRTARVDELEALAELILSMAWESEEMRLNREKLLAGIGAVFAQPGLGTYWVATSGEQLLACTLITVEWSDWHNAAYWWIQSLYIQPAFRGKGMFEQLLTEVEAAAKHAGVRELRLYVEKDNARAIRVYHRNGFDDEHYRYMGKRLL